MPDYRVFFLGANGKIFASDDFWAETDRDAAAVANRLAHSQASAFELWQGNRRLHAGAVEAHGAKPE